MISRSPGRRRQLVCRGVGALLAFTLVSGVVVAVASAAPVSAQESEPVEYVEPEGTKNGYPLYKVTNDGRHLPPMGGAARGARAAVTLVHAGVRYYGYFIIPANPQNVRLPLIVTAHGVNQTGSEQYMRMQGNAEARRYATLDVDGYSGSWNAGRCCGTAVERGYDSSGGIVRLIEEFGYAHGYNKGRLYLAGFSNGGMLAYRMACERPAMFAAVAVVAAAHVTGCRPAGPVPVLHVHGTGDRTVPYGGTSYSSSLRTRLPSAQQTTDLWRRKNSESGATTTLISLRGVGHLWPTTANSGYDATGQIQNFLLKRHRR